MDVFGRYVSFQSHATNLVAGDTNGVVDVFVQDRSTGVTTRESLGPVGVQGNAISEAPSISGDGRFLVFQSNATNLVPNDFNGVTDCFLRDRMLGTTSRLSLAWDGAEADAACLYPWISTNGRYVTFYSQATNLVAGDTNGVTDIFVRDLISGTTERVSVSETGIQGNGRSEFASMSGDGRYVVFHSGADTLAPGDTNGFWDIFVKDMITGSVHIASVTSAGVQSNGHSGGAGISENGRFVVFSTDSTNLDGPDTNGVRDSIIRDLQAGITEKVSVGPGGAEGNGESIGPVVNEDGRIVAFSSMASNLVAGDTNGTWDVLIRDRLTGSTSLVSRNTAGVQGNGETHGPIISASGLHIGFQSLATNLVTGDTNNSLDAFVHNRQALIQPSSYSLFRGSLVGGNLQSLAFSDNERMVLQPGVVFSTSEAPIQLILNATSPFTTSTIYQFEVEWHATSTNVQQTLDVWNFATSSYTTIAVTQAATSDFTQLVVASPSEEFIGPQGEIRARLSYRATGPVFSYPWQARIDRARFIISP
jgi:Tol biopolymer transport system component